VSGRHNVILGVAEGMAWAEIEPFVRSLRRTTYDGDVLLYTADLDPHTIDALRTADVEVLRMRRAHLPARGRRLTPYDPRLARLHGRYPALVGRASRWSRDPTSAAAALAAAISVRDIRRFFLYYRHVRSHGYAYENVMLTDVRDVIFQKDPFAFDIGGALHCYLEDTGRTLGSEPYNRRWLQTAFGQEVAHELRDRPIACAGVTIGPTELVVEYLRVMVEHLLRLPVQTTGLDQAVHNYVLHSKRVPSALLVPNGNGTVATLGIMPTDEVRPLLGAAVLHQYDRHPELAASLLDELAGEG
jgi:hypothetical protein